MRRFLTLTAKEAAFWHDSLYWERSDYPEYQNEMMKLLAACGARVTPTEYQSNLISLCELARGNKFKLLLLESPFQERTRDPYFLSFHMKYDIERYRQKLRIVGQRFNVNVVRIPMLTELHDDENTSYFHDIVHPNEKGCALIADTISRVIQGLRDKKQSSNRAMILAHARKKGEGT